MTVRVWMSGAVSLLLMAASQSWAQPAPENPEAPAARGKPTSAVSGQPPGLAVETPGQNGRSDPNCDATGPSPEGARSTDPRADRARCRKLLDSDIASAPIAEIRKVTHHTAVIAGRPFAYTATAGTLTIRDDEGKPTLSMFYVAYTAGDGRDTHRPVTFMYNGGPGSSSMWLHMGSLGPVRVATDSPAPTHSAPYAIVDNNESLLDKSDLVFLDAPGAGFSRPLGDTKLAAFWGTDPDIDTFARGIERYLTLYDRWNSPKVIFGESYGTTLLGGASLYRLQETAGAQLNGVVLLSSILNYGRRDPGFDQELINYLPSYAATAAYHHRLANAPTDLPAFLREVREFARGPYALALAQGQELDPGQRQAIAQKLASYTGLSPAFILEADLRVTPQRFRKELLRDQRLTLGRY